MLYFKNWILNIELRIIRIFLFVELMFFIIILKLLLPNNIYVIYKK